MKSLKLFLFFLSFSFANLVLACQTDITLSTQAEVDQFQNNYPGCTVIEGYLTISGADITNLNGLSVLVGIKYDLTIEDNNVLTDISGLSNIRKIGGRLFFATNGLINNLNGFEGLDSIIGSCYCNLKYL